DQGIIRSFKCRYNQNFNKTMVSWRVIGSLNNYTLRMCIDNAFKSWHEVHHNVFTQAWVNIQDNCPAHCSDYVNKTLVCLENVKIEFLPKNTTSITQPLDAEVIKCVKQSYRKSLVQLIITEIDENNVPGIRDISLIEAIRIISC
ncbi:hypothetical protein A3Q56_06616, partial [Intoshia linei]